MAEATVVEVLPRLELPYFTALSPKVLARVRRDEAAFEDFRRVLRDVARQLPVDSDGGASDRDVQGIERDVLAPAVAALLDDVSGVRALRKSLSESGIELVAAALVGLFVAPNVLTAVGVAAMTVVAQAMAKLAVDRKEDRPASRAVLAFHTGRVPRVGIGWSPGGW